MKIEWHFEEKDIQAVRQVIEQQSQRVLVRQRIEYNVDGPLPPLNRKMMWHRHIMCLLTSQQKSGPGKPVYRFLQQPPFPLSLDKCQRKDLGSFVENELGKHGGIRFSPKISKQVSANLDFLERRGWRELERIAGDLLAQRAKPPSPPQYKLERSAALYMDESLHGFGPKQSRNFWQDLGLIRYEFVLDSRILRWLRKLELGIPLSSSGLQDEEYYSWVSDILRDLCLKANVLPCVFDAAVFASYDTEEWSANSSVV